MYNPTSDLAFFEAGIAELHDYLLSDILYWKLSGRQRAELPMLTIGGLLLARKRLQAAPSPTLDALDFEMQAQRLKWQAAWERKIRHEVRARTELWHNFLSEYRHAPDQHAASYPQEVRWRVMMHLLLEELNDLPAEAEVLIELDRILRLSFIPNRFIWDPDLLPFFERDLYWYLYGVLKS